MGQCVSQQPFPQHQAITDVPNNPSTLSNTSGDNQSNTEISNGSNAADELLGNGAVRTNPMIGSMRIKSRKSRKSSISNILSKSRAGSIRSKADKGGSLSAACNLTFNKFEITALDINTATEEELMTLTGITRTIAHEIVEHRNKIGAFKKVEDLALVSGVGAAKLQVIKPEISIVMKGPSNAPSINNGNILANSFDGFSETISLAPSPKAGRSQRRQRILVNINTATMFQLMSVDGITQERAAHIVHYRERKGPFKTLYDLRRVAGFNSRLISALGPYLCVESSPTQATNGFVKNGHSLSSIGHRRAASLPSGPLSHSFNRPSSPQLSHQSPEFPSLTEFKKVLDDSEKITEEGDPAQAAMETNGNGFEEDTTLRIMVWNLDQLCRDKARNRGVVEVMAKLLVDNQVKVAVIYGLADAYALSLLCDNVNNQRDVMISKPYSVSLAGDGCGYLHTVGLTTQSVTLISPSLTLNVAKIEMDKASYTLVTSPPLNASNSSPTFVPQLVKSVTDLSTTERIIFASEFAENEASKYIEEFQNLGYRPMVQKDVSTSKSLLEGDRLQTNILVNRFAQKLLTGKYGLITEGLTHLLIPQNWRWNGPASNYYPFWVELNIEEDQADGV